MLSLAQIIASQNSGKIENVIQSTVSLIIQ